MPVDAFLLALAAAAVHAGWNIGLAGTTDPRRATAGATAIAAVLCLPLAVVTWDVDVEALPYAAASIVLEVAYFVLLARAYARADLGVVYPIARGAAPVLVLGAAALVGRGDPSPLQVVGVLLVAAGVLVLRSGPGPAAGRDVALALAVGATIAGYVVVDDAGLEHAATVPYLCLVVGVPSAIYALAFAARAGSAAAHSLRFAVSLGPALLDRRARRRAGRRHALRCGLAALRDQISPLTAAVGTGMVIAFGLTLAALELADPAPVAAIREGSVVIAAVLAPRLLGERGGAARLGGAAAVFAGVAAVALG